MMTLAKRMEAVIERFPGDRTDQKSNSTTETKWCHTDHRGGKRFPASHKANTRIKKHILEMAINMTC